VHLKNNLDLKMTCLPQLLTFASCYSYHLSPKTIEKPKSVQSDRFDVSFHSTLTGNIRSWTS